MGEEFQGGVCGGMCWNPPHSLFSDGLSSPCSVAQLGGGGGGFDMGTFGWPNEAVIKGGNKATTTITTNNTSKVFENLIFHDEIDSSLDILGFGLSPTSSTTDWNHQNLICNSGSNEGNFDSFLQDNMNNSRLSSAYSMVANSPNIVNSNNFSNNTNNVINNTCQDASPPKTLTASSNSSGESSTITCEGGLTTSFPMNSSASYLIQSLFDDSDDQFIINNNNNNSNNNPWSYGSMDSSSEIISSYSWVKTSLGVDDQTHLLPKLQLLQSNSNKLDNGGISSMMMNNTHGQILSGQYSPTTLNNIKASLLNSLQSRSRGPNSLNQKSQSCATSLPNKMNGDEHHRDSKSKNNDQHQAKRARIETPSPLPTFKVRKEKLGDRITALQQLVSPFGKTDTASVLHEAIEYIKFLHDQVHVLSTPYLKSGSAMQQQDSGKSKDNEESTTQHDLRGRGLCLVPISSTYPVAQETPVDFWTPTFGGKTFM